MSDIKLKIRHAKRSGDTYLDLSNSDMTDIPIEIKQLTMLEKLNLQGNKLTDLSKIFSLPNLKEVHAGNNKISSLSSEIQQMMSLETLILSGNPVCNLNPDLAQIEKDRKNLLKVLDKYFSGGSGIGSAMGAMSLGGPVKHGSFLSPAQDNLGDPAALRKRIAELEAENTDLKVGSGKSQTMRAGNADWMQFNQGFERPTTASKRVQDGQQNQEELKLERKEKIRLAQEVELLKKELQKQQFQSFASSQAINTQSGRLPNVPGVREIELSELLIGE